MQPKEIIHNNLKTVQDTVNSVQKTSGNTQEITIVAVTKYATNDQIQGLLENQHVVLGENKIQIIEQKQERFDNPSIEWHMIGHLQSNKVKKAVEHFDWIQSADSLKVLSKIDAQSKALNKPVNVLIQVNTAREPQKHGFDPKELWNDKDNIFSFSNCKIRGIMCMAPLTEDTHLIENCFKQTKELYDLLKQHYPFLDTLSMGMSRDYKIAVENGATMIRLGTVLYQGT